VKLGGSYFRKPMAMMVSTTRCLTRRMSPKKDSLSLLIYR
jgi:hypothetical protein